MTEPNRNIWPELTYRYVEHYFWKPQDLIKTPSSRKVAKERGEKLVDAFYNKIRQIEEPLNYLLNVFLRLAPASLRSAFLHAFTTPQNAKGFAATELLNSPDLPFTQPDVHLESATTRIFIELKVNKEMTLQQVQKYALLHAHYNQLDRQDKTPYLLFIQRRPFSHHWDVKTERAAIEAEGVHAFLRQQLITQPLSDNVAKHKETSPLADKYRSVLPQLVFSSLTWQQVGDSIQSESACRIAALPTEAAEMLQTLTTDFLQDLNRRGLWQPGNTTKELQ